MQWYHNKFKLIQRKEEKGKGKERRKEKILVISIKKKTWEGEGGKQCWTLILSSATFLYTCLYFLSTICHYAVFLVKSATVKFGTQNIRGQL